MTKKSNWLLYRDFGAPYYSFCSTFSTKAEAEEFGESEFGADNFWIAKNENPFVSSEEEEEILFTDQSGWDLSFSLLKRQRLFVCKFNVLEYPFFVSQETAVCQISFPSADDLKKAIQTLENSTEFRICWEFGVQELFVLEIQS